MSRYFPEATEFGRHTIFGSIAARTCAGDHMLFSFVEIPANGVVAEHSHFHEQMGVVLEGEMNFTIGGETRLLRAGDVFRIPGGVPHSVTVGEKPVKCLDVFHPVREEYR
jgi:quercetin dioxygenase-like cupin family protein